MSYIDKRITVYVPYDDVDHDVIIEHRDSELVRLTPDEARDLAQTLIDRADYAETQDDPTPDHQWQVTEPQEEPV